MGGGGGGGGIPDAGMGAIGAIGGAQGTNTSVNSFTNSYSNMNLQDFASLNQGASGLETSGYNASLNSLNSLQSLVNAGPGQSAVTGANAAGNQYASLLNQFVSNNGLPTAQQNTAAQGYAASQFAPQQTALQQSFIQQQQAGARSAAAMGRSGADPVLLAKLGVSETQQQSQLNSQQGALASQTAMQMPQTQLNMANSLFSLKQGLATQAMNNRSTLLQLGNQLSNSERAYRIQTANKTSGSSGNTSTHTGGGAGGAIAGGLAGAGSGPSMGSIAAMF